MSLLVYNTCLLEMHIEVHVFMCVCVCVCARARDMSIIFVHFK